MVADYALHFSLRTTTLKRQVISSPLPLSLQPTSSRHPTLLVQQWVVTTKVDPHHGSCAVQSPSQEQPEKSSSSRAGNVQTTGFVSHTPPLCPFPASALLLTVRPPCLARDLVAPRPHSVLHSQLLSDHPRTTYYQYPKEVGSQQTVCWKQRHREKLWKKVSSFVLFPASQLPNTFGPLPFHAFCIIGTYAFVLHPRTSSICRCAMLKPRLLVRRTRFINPAFLPHPGEFKHQREYVAKLRGSLRRSTRRRRRIISTNSMCILSTRSGSSARNGRGSGSTTTKPFDGYLGRRSLPKASCSLLWPLGDLARQASLRHSSVCSW